MPKPSKSASARDAAERQDVRDAIELANHAAGDDDAAFLELLRTRARGGAFGGVERAVGSGGGRRLPVVNHAAPARSFEILKDSRYLKNARSLALRTLGGLRVIGGQEVPPGEFLDCVAVGSDTTWGCTGTLIASNTVLTAGHCADFATRVYFGSNVRKKGQVVRVKKRVRHPQYHKSDNNDLMILILEAEVPVAPRRLATKAQIDKATDGRVVGFGHSNAFGTSGYGIKRLVDVPVASAACRGKTKGQTDAMTYGCDPSLEIVAGRPMLAKDGCKGDSGGPFYLLVKKDTWVLGGATSRATKSSMHTCGDGGIYARMDAYRAWIMSIPGVKL
jgi:secreted trypsin-like serine protease